MKTLDELQEILHPLNRKNLSQEEHEVAATEFQLQLSEISKRHPEALSEKQMSTWNDNGSNVPGR